MVSDKELKLIAELRVDARETLTNLSKKTSIPISTIFDRLKEYNSSIIKKTTAILNYEELGFTTRATIAIKVDRVKREEAKEYLLKHPNVNNVFRINNGFDFLIDAIFKNIKAGDIFLELIEEKFSVTEKQVHYIIDELKTEGFLSDADLIKMTQ